MNDQYPRLAYRVNDACRLLSIGRTTLYALAKDGKLNIKRIAGRSLIAREDLERLLRESD